MTPSITPLLYLTHTNGLPEPRSTAKSVKAFGREPLGNVPTNYIILYIPEPILGLYFGNTDCTLRNIQPRITKIQNTINAWANRDLSFKGKALLINGLLTSVLWYRSTAITFPPWAVRDIEHII